MDYSSIVCVNPELLSSDEALHQAALSGAIRSKHGNGLAAFNLHAGLVETPILKDFLETLGERAEEDMKIMDRPGRPEDIAPVIAFLCSDGSGWIRGTNIPTDGGMFSHIQCATRGLL